MEFPRPGLVVLVFLSLVAGCKQEIIRRPVAGDRVTPELDITQPWQTGRPPLMTVLLKAQGPGQVEPAFLTMDDVPEDLVPHAAIEFFKDGRAMPSISDVPLKRFC